jgi:hypothetical protein
VNLNPNLMGAGHYEPASCVTIGALLGYFAYHAALGRAAKQKQFLETGDPQHRQKR